MMICSFSTVKPSPPVNLSHIQTIEAELILHWDDPSDFDAGPLRYEVRYSSNSSHPAWQVTLSIGEILPTVRYLVRVCCGTHWESYDLKILVPLYNKVAFIKGL